METKTSQLRGGIARGTEAPAGWERRNEGGNKERSGRGLGASEVEAVDCPSQQRPRVTVLLHNRGRARHKWRTPVQTESESSEAPCSVPSCLMDVEMTSERALSVAVPAQVRPHPPAGQPAAARSLPPPLPPPLLPGCASDCQIKRLAEPAGRRARPGPDMAALYACTKCHQRFPFEALSQGQQLCKVRGLGRRPGTGTLEARPRAPCSAGTPGGGPLRRAWQARLAEEPHPPRWGLVGLLGSPEPGPGPLGRRVRLLSNREELFSDPGRSGEGTAGPLLGPNQPR